MRWKDLKIEEKSAYWIVVPDDPNSILDSLEYEIVYVYFDGKWSIMRPGEQKREDPNNFEFIRIIPPMSDITEFKATNQKILNQLISPQYTLKRWVIKPNTYDIYYRSIRVGHIEYEPTHARIRREVYQLVLSNIIDITYDDPEYQIKLNNLLKECTDACLLIPSLRNP